MKKGCSNCKKHVELDVKSLLANRGTTTPEACKDCKEYSDWVAKLKVSGKFHMRHKNIYRARMRLCYAD